MRTRIQRMRRTWRTRRIWRIQQIQRIQRIWRIPRTRWIRRTRRVWRIRGFGGFSGFGGFDGVGGFSGFDGYPMLYLKGYLVSFSLLLKVLCLLVSYSLSYTWLKREPQISIRKERFILSLLIYFKLTKLQKFLQK